MKYEDNLTRYTYLNMQYLDESMKLAWIYLSDEINLIWVEKKLQPDVKNGSKSRIHFVTQCSENGKIVQ